MNERTHTPRRRRLIKPRVQLRLIATFIAVAAIGMMLQSLYFNARLAELAAAASPAVADVLAERVSAINLSALVISFLVLLPIAVCVGVLATFRIAGPLYRFEQHLDQVARNEDRGPCRLRKGDELQDLCGQINETVESLRATHRASTASGPSDDSTSNRAA